MTTTDETRTLADVVSCCPRCGKDEISHGYSFPPMQGVVECHADDCGAICVAITEDHAVEMWNNGRWTHRTVGFDDDGKAVIEFDPHGAIE